MKSNTTQDVTSSSVEQHYEEVLSSSQTLQQISGIEKGKEIASNLQSPTGKGNILQSLSFIFDEKIFFLGAALFAKRKKRMDKFIVDESTVQQQSSTLSSSYQESSSVSQFSQETKVSLSLKTYHVRDCT